MSSTPLVAGRVPYDKTAVRPSWLELPEAVRARVDHHVGSPVVHTRTATGGFTRGFAALVTTRDGDECFVKAASTESAPIAATSYATEARVLGARTAATSAPRPCPGSSTDAAELATPLIRTSEVPIR